MTDANGSSSYEVVLAPEALRVLLGLPAQGRKDVAEAIAAELDDGPNADKEVRFDSSIKPWADPGNADGQVYRATPLSTGYTAIHRCMTGDELGRLGREQGRPVAGKGFYVISVLPAEAAFRRGRG